MSHRPPGRSGVALAMLAIAGASLVALGACATQVVPPKDELNQPPKLRFNEYSKFDLRWTNKAEGCNQQHGASQMIEALDIQLRARLAGTLRTWEKPAARGTLAIEPVCADAKLIGTAARVFAGPFPGASVAVFKLRFTDVQTGERLAEPVFYQRAAALSGTFSLGAMDRQMIKRLVELMSTYTTVNYAELVGGPSGAEDLLKK